MGPATGYYLQATPNPMPTTPRLRCANDLLKFSNTPVEQAAAILAREPASPVTRAIKLWGDDEEPYSQLMRGKTSDAREWRQIIHQVLANLEPFASTKPVYRGWSFSSAKARSEFMQAVWKRGGFANRRIGMSASRRRNVSTGKAFLNVHGMVWEIRGHRTARNVAGIFAAVGTKYPQQREVIFPRGSRFLLIEMNRQFRVVRGGHSVRVPYFILKELS